VSLYTLGEISQVRLPKTKLHTISLKASQLVPDSFHTFVLEDSLQNARPNTAILALPIPTHKAFRGCHKLTYPSLSHPRSSVRPSVLSVDPIDYFSAPLYLPLSQHLPSAQDKDKGQLGCPRCIAGTVMPHQYPGFVGYVHRQRKMGHEE
jgi:hypothetical protein